MKTLYRTVPSGALIFEDGTPAVIGESLFPTPQALKRQNPSARYTDAEQQPIALESCSDRPDASYKHFRSGFWLRTLPDAVEAQGDVPALSVDDLAEQTRELERLGLYPTSVATVGDPQRLDSLGNPIVTAVSPEEALQQQQEPPKPRVENIDGVWFLDGTETIVEPTEENIRLSRDDDPWSIAAREQGRRTLQELAQRRREAEQRREASLPEKAAASVAAPSSVDSPE